jgi:hypothetical protein
MNQIKKSNEGLIFLKGNGWLRDQIKKLKSYKRIRDQIKKSNEKPNLKNMDDSCNTHVNEWGK